MARRIVEAVTSNDAFPWLGYRLHRIHEASETCPSHPTHEPGWHPGPEPQPEKSRDSKPFYTLKLFPKGLSIDTSSVHRFSLSDICTVFRVEIGVVMIVGFGPQLSVISAGGSWQSSVPTRISKLQVQAPLTARSLTPRKRS